MPYYHKLTKNYLEQTLKRIKDSIYRPVADLDVTIYVTEEPVPFSMKESGTMRKISVGETWGKLWDCAWFHFTGEVPETAKGENVVLLIDVSGEACVFDENGCPVQGLTTASSAFARFQGLPDKRVVRMFEKARGGEKIDLWADAGCNDLFGNYQDNGILMEACIAICNENMEQLYYDFEVLFDLMNSLSEDRARHHSILWTLNEAANTLKNFTSEEAAKARELLSKELNKKGGDPSITVSAIGHAHIDLAWLWPVRETIRKGARTFSTVLKNMERYPDYVFGASQPQLFQWMKDYYPALYEKIKQRVAEGRWEVQGAMWVEADTNISGGEALVRQVLYGKMFFRDEFGIDMKYLWLPDVFGYTAALPQILKKSGVDYFMTTKLSWSEFNTYPHHTFWWKGLDGSRVLTHMSPGDSYNSPVTPNAIIRAENRYLDKGVCDGFLILFGIGDGGGGPGEEHLERLRREKNLEGLPPVVQEPAINFFRRIEAGADRYKTWQGELYLEFHRGTYTSQARNKRYNRKLELALRDLEIASVMAMIESGKPYPQEELEKMWKEVLFYQFHDILPGSSITRVYTESLEGYKRIEENTKKLTADAYSALSKAGLNKAAEDVAARDRATGCEVTDDNSANNCNVTRDNTAQCNAEVRNMNVYNTLSWERTEWIKVNGQWKRVTVPAMGAADLSSACADVPEVCSGSENRLENDCLVVEFNAEGDIVSIYDKKNDRQVLAGEPANRLAVYDDIGDAWDIKIMYEEKAPDTFSLERVETVQDGPKVIRRSHYCYNQSALVQEIILTAGSPRIDFVTRVDWKERGKMLRTDFTVNVFAAEATCDIQFGNLKRPAHRNTSWDMAKYEVCAHKWVDLSQGDYGVALLNDCKYGYKIHENTIGLNLLRSPSYPDPVADCAVHEFTYSLLPHSGDYRKGNVVRAGYELNVPLAVVPGSKDSGFLKRPLVSVDAENVIVEAVKKAEDNNDIIIRLYECHGAGARTGISLGFGYKSVRLVNLMEEPVDDDAFDSKRMELVFRPYEIHTLRVEL